MTQENVINQLKKIVIKQDEQKKRGLNNYNILTAVRSANAEVGMHSNFIYSLLNTNGDHYQNTLFAKIFIDKVLKLNDFGEKIDVKVEEQTKHGRRIDFTIKGEHYFIGIEMKIDASDLNNQIADYYDDLQKKAEKDKNQTVIIYYLTKDGKDTSKSSCKGKDYKKISFEKDILDWLNACQKEVGNITNLNYAIESYKDVIKMIINKYETPIDSFKTHFMNDKEFFTTFKDNKDDILKENFFSKENIENINKEFENAQRSLTDDFFKSLFEDIITKHKGLYYFHYARNIVGYSYIIIFMLPDKSEIRIYMRRNKLISIGMHPFEKETEFGDYRIGKRKGMNFQEVFEFEIDDAVLFKKRDIKLTQPIIDEISAHIDEITRLSRHKAVLLSS